MYLLNNNKFAFVFNSAEVGTAALKIFPSSVDNYCDFGLFSVVRPYIYKAV